MSCCNPAATLYKYILFETNTIELIENELNVLIATPLFPNIFCQITIIYICTYEYKDGIFFSLLVNVIKNTRSFDCNFPIKKSTCYFIHQSEKERVFFHTCLSINFYQICYIYTIHLHTYIHTYIHTYLCKYKFKKGKTSFLVFVFISTY